MENALDYLRKKTHTLEDVLEGYEITSNSEEKELQKKIDDVFSFFYANHCTPTVYELSDKFNVEARVVYDYFTRAGIRMDINENEL